MLIRQMIPEELRIAARSTTARGWMNAWFRQFADSMHSVFECARAELPFDDVMFYATRATEDLANAIGWASRAEG